MTHTTCTHIYNSHFATFPMRSPNNYQSIFYCSPSKNIFTQNINNKKLDSIMEENESENKSESVYYTESFPIRKKNISNKYITFQILDTIFEHDEFIVISRKNIKISQV